MLVSSNISLTLDGGPGYEYKYSFYRTKRDPPPSQDQRTNNQRTNTSTSQRTKELEPQLFTLSKTMFLLVSLLDHILKYVTRNRNLDNSNTLAFMKLDLCNTYLQTSSTPTKDAVTLLCPLI